MYQRTIVRAARNFEGLAWVSYDICYRRKVARCRDLHWSRVDSALYHEAFTGRARSVPRCSLCLSPHHSSGQCAFAPVGSVQVGGQQSTGVSVTPSSSRGIGGGGQWCGLYNRAGADACRFRNCRFPHHCRDCLVKGRRQQSHPASACPHSNFSSRDRFSGKKRPYFRHRLGRKEDVCSWPEQPLGSADTGTLFITALPDVCMVSVGCRSIYIQSSICTNVIIVVMQCSSPSDTLYRRDHPPFGVQFAWDNIIVMYLTYIMMSLVIL